MIKAERAQPKMVQSDITLGRNYPSAGYMRCSILIDCQSQFRFEAWLPKSKESLNSLSKSQQDHESLPQLQMTVNRRNHHDLHVDLQEIRTKKIVKMF